MGANLRDPLPQSTNYLSAYDRHGNLARLGDANEDAANRGQPRPDGSQLPPERRSDLRPFPLNRFFLSEPVLSEELREIIWTRIMKDGMSVQEVSAQLGVEMSRVGAVVRLKEVEKAWISSVSFTIPHCLRKPS